MLMLAQRLEQRMFEKILLDRALDELEQTKKELEELKEKYDKLKKVCQKSLDLLKRIVRN